MLLNNKFDFENAYEAFTKSLSLNPNDVETLINKSISEENLSLYEEAVETLQHAISLEPSNDEVVFSAHTRYSAS